MSFMDVMYGPLGQVNNQFQANLGQNAAAMGNQQNFYGDLSNLGAYNQAVTNNLYGAGGFGGDTAKYAYLGAAYGRDTGGYGGYGGQNDPFSPAGGYGGGDAGIAGWGSQPMGDPGALQKWMQDHGGDPSGFTGPSSFNERFPGYPYSGMPSEIMQGWSAPQAPAAWQPAADPGGIRGGMGGGAWDTQDPWGRSYTPPVQGYGGDPASAYPMWGANQGRPDYNGDMWGGKAPGQYGAYDEAFDKWASGDPAWGNAFGLGAAPSFNDRFTAFSPGTGSSYGPGYFDNTFGSANDMQASRDAIARTWMNQQMAGGDSRYTQGGNIYTFGMPGSGYVGGPSDTFTGWDYQRGTPGGFDQRYYASPPPMSYQQGVDELARLYNDVLGPGGGRSGGTLTPSDIMIDPFGSARQSTLGGGG